MTYDLSKMTPAQLAELAKQLQTLAGFADGMALQCGVEPVIDLTSGPMICFPLFAPVPVVRPIPQAAAERAVADLPVTRTICPDMQAAKVDPVRRVVPEVTAKVKALPPAPDLHKPRPWTDADEIAVLAAVGRDLGASNMVIARSVARGIGRTPDAVAFRLKTILAERAALLRDSKQAATPPAAQSEPTPMPSFAIAPPIDASFPYRAVNSCLNGLGYVSPWTPSLDFDLATHLARGVKLPVIALSLDIDAEACAARWKRLKSQATNDNRRFGVDEQTLLLTVLRARAAQKSMAAE